LAPTAAAAFTNSIWPPTLVSATVTVSGTLPPISSATHSMSWRRSAVESLLTSLAKPSTPMPCTLCLSIDWTCRRMGSRAKLPLSSNRA